MSNPLKIAIIGAGNRGLRTYGQYILEHPEDARVVAVAEPRAWYREEAKRLHRIPEEHVFSDWRELLAQPRLADAVIIATPDQQHVAPTVTAAQKGYDILLEKPMAVSEEDCQLIISTVKDHDILLSVCHVLRYTPFYQKVRQIIEEGELGDIVTLRHFEQIGFWNFAHAFVRGNWSNAEQSAPLILAKSCHDMDILCYLLGQRCTHISSFGSLSHFKAENLPPGAAQRCLDCQITCPYSAKDFYLSRLHAGKTGWPLNTITADVSEEGVLKALRESPYGRCVYQSENTVVDHQVVALQFEGGSTATYTVTAFTTEEHRSIEVYGTHGELRGNDRHIEVRLFDGTEQQLSFEPQMNTTRTGHMGGDSGLMRDFLNSVRTREATISGPESAFDSHRMAFAAERSRLHNGRTEAL